VTKLNGVNVTEYALVSSLSNYVDLDIIKNYATITDLTNYATEGSLSTLAGRVTTVETKTSGFNADGTELTV